MKVFICGKVGSHTVVRINTERAHVCFACFLQQPAKQATPRTRTVTLLPRRQNVPSAGCPAGLWSSDGHACSSLALIPGHRVPFATSIILPFQEHYVDETRPCVTFGYWLFFPQHNSLETQLDFCMSAVFSFFFFCFAEWSPRCEWTTVFNTHLLKDICVVSAWVYRE